VWGVMMVYIAHALRALMRGITDNYFDVRAKRGSITQPSNQLPNKNKKECQTTNRACTNILGKVDPLMS